MVLGGAWAGWFLVVVFGPSAVVLALALRPQSNTLAIDDDGYTVHSVFRSTRVPWSDVERVGAVDATHGRRVAIRFTASRAGTMADAAALAAALGGFHCILPLDYGIGADDVAELMRQRASRAR